MPEFHTISYHKSVAETCYVVARDLLFFCFSHRSRTVFLGMPIRVCLHLSKIIFKAQWGWPRRFIFYCCKSIFPLFVKFTWGMLLISLNKSSLHFGMVQEQIYVGRRFIFQQDNDTKTTKFTTNTNKLCSWLRWTLSKSFYCFANKSKNL